MTKESKQEPSIEIESGNKAQDDSLVDCDYLTKPEAANSRRPGLSKREIMEELSRERFPWDE
ncbi:hypothetical protein [Polynucleobacter sp. AP-Kolm-20A-A1]|uniref:hypothetical protein n=1 Tax=Polynucleobacter sp. AP-Kolm-20A-A1 TaxID=2081041 RepID=UPI001BFDC7CF|nr:hypothetical protein [Polynucleobacter sp. AP-Kolm-20A-A1]QWE20114.1 hypothetical protein C2745_06835 [Polynucleobacter sp. AP-Kolm-20A-A1]